MAEPSSPLPELLPDEQIRYEWQMWVRDFGEAGQRRLKSSTVMISRIGGVGGTVALQLAAAGVGRLILAHAGDVRLNDLNRQVLMTTEGVGRPRVESAVRKLQDLNPRVAVEVVNENVDDRNAERLIDSADVVVAAAPRFEERLSLNRAAVRRLVPLVDCAMYELEGRLLTVVPGASPCLACLYPDVPPNWKREFPVFGAVASTVASIGAMEVIKLLAGIGMVAAGRMFRFDLRDLSFSTLEVSRRSDCRVCGHLTSKELS